jgi:hypothetical protein
MSLSSSSTKPKAAADSSFFGTMKMSFSQRWPAWTAIKRDQQPSKPLNFTIAISDRYRPSADAVKVGDCDGKFILP